MSRQLLPVCFHTPRCSCLPVDCPVYSRTWLTNATHGTARQCVHRIDRIAALVASVASIITIPASAVADFLLKGEYYHSPFAWLVCSLHYTQKSFGFSQAKHRVYPDRLRTAKEVISFFASSIVVATTGDCADRRGIRPDGH